MIIGLSGKAGSGKDTVADIIRANTSLETKTLAFGDAVKHITGEILEIDRETIERYKREDIPVSGFPIRVWLQKIGTLFREKVSYDYWISYVLDPAQATFGNWDNKLIIITDVRYLNEANAIKNWGGKIIRVNRDVEEKSSHASETELDNYKFDYIIDNNSNIIQLRENVLNTLKEIL